MPTRPTPPFRAGLSSESAAIFLITPQRLHRTRSQSGKPRPATLSHRRRKADQREEKHGQQQVEGDHCRGDHPHQSPERLLRY